MQVITVFLPDYLHKQRGMSIKTATVVNMVFGAATVAGQVVGAKVGQSLYNRRARNQALLMGVRVLHALSVTSLFLTTAVFSLHRVCVCCAC
ncbi:unnamed protein product [Ectocarpus fasciculatus]